MNNPFRRTSRPGNVEIFELEQQLDTARKEINAAHRLADQLAADRDVWRHRAERFSDRIEDLEQRLAAAQKSAATLVASETKAA